MRSFQTKRKWKDALSSRPVLAFLGVIVLVFTWSVYGFWGKMRETTKNAKIAENKVAGLEKQKAELSADIAKLKTDAGVEDSIRDKFGLAREGEGVIVIVDDRSKLEDTQQANTSGFWSFFINWFK